MQQLHRAGSLKGLVNFRGHAHRNIVFSHFLSRRYSALLRGLSQIFSYIAGAISPTVAGFFISQDGLYLAKFMVTNSVTGRMMMLH
ncbi:hypothetical protein J1605_004450 [Eschrichtius robustus]|uniref:Uncharacterized protein n=1 Tax=Eschrichtius robustus TaxID=9764 RepID=A0AB34HH66_ESCRO|nr:hypothetical protein J1605_004450 [Eschrichtius robustus]